MSTPTAREFREVVCRADSDRAAQLIDSHWLELWYSIDPVDLAEVLRLLPPQGDLGRRRILDGLVNDSRPHLGATPIDLPGHEALAGPGSLEQQFVNLRRYGRPLSALALLKAHPELAHTHRGQFLDTSEGFSALWSVQVGLAHLQAGDFDSAIGHFAVASLAHRPVRFPFIVRDAQVKAALALALSGDIASAQDWLDKATQCDRTPSWIESNTDAVERLARYIIATDLADWVEAERLRLTLTPPRSVPEVPEVVVQSHVRHLVLTGRRHLAHDLCVQAQLSGLPRPGSEGWIASIVDESIMRTVAVGSPIEHTQHPSGVAELSHQIHRMASGQYAAAAVSRWRQPPDTWADHRLRLAFSLLRAQGLILSGSEDEGLAALRDVIAEVEERQVLRVYRFFTPTVLERLERFDEFADTISFIRGSGLGLLQTVVPLSEPLTPSEVTAMAHLAEGLSRSQIAAALFISENTVRSHLKAAYRKLNASTRQEAVSKYDRLGYPAQPLDGHLT